MPPLRTADAGGDGAHARKTASHCGSFARSRRGTCAAFGSGVWGGRSGLEVSLRGSRACGVLAPRRGRGVTCGRSPCRLEPLPVRRRAGTSCAAEVGRWSARDAQATPNASAHRAGRARQETIRSIRPWVTPGPGRSIPPSGTARSRLKRPRQTRAFHPCLSPTRHPRERARRECLPRSATRRSILALSPGEK